MRTRKAPDPRVTVRVLKFPIPIDDQWHELPYHRTHDGENGYHIGMQDGVVMLWTVPATEVVEADDRTDKLKVVGTGHEWNALNCYIGTVQDPRGFVWHVISGGHE